MDQKCIPSSIYKKFRVPWSSLEFLKAPRSCKGWSSKNERFKNQPFPRVCCTKNLENAIRNSKFWIFRPTQFVKVSLRFQIFICNLEFWWFLYYVYSTGLYRIGFWSFLVFQSCEKNLVNTVPNDHSQPVTKFPMKMRSLWQGKIHP